MNRRLARYAKWAVKLLLTEMFVPGGTLVVLVLLLAGRSSHWTGRSLLTLIPFWRKNGRPALGSALTAEPALQRLE